MLSCLLPSLYELLRLSSRELSLVVDLVVMCPAVSVRVLMDVNTVPPQLAL